MEKSQKGHCKNKDDFSGVVNDNLLQLAKKEVRA